MMLKETQGILAIKNLASSKTGTMYARNEEKRHADKDKNDMQIADLLALCPQQHANVNLTDETSLFQIGDASLFEISQENQEEDWTIVGRFSWKEADVVVIEKDVTASAEMEAGVQLNWDRDALESCVSEFEDSICNTSHI